VARILIAGINYAPECISTGKYTSEMAQWLASRGHEVRVVTAAPYYPEWKVWPGYRRWWYQRETIAGVQVIRCPFWVPAHPNGLTRLLHLASFGLTSLPILLASAFWRPQLAVNIEPTKASAVGVWLCGLLSGARTWLHIQDFELDAALDLGIVKAGPLRRGAIAMERWLSRRFDRVSTISLKMRDRLASKGVAPDRQVLFPNWVDVDAIRELDGPSPYRRELGIADEAVVALYSGNMGQKQGLELLGEAAHALSSSANLHFVVGGDGPARKPLEAVCAGLPNVHFLDLQPSERLSEWLGLADIHLLPQRADVADLVMPSKLTGMLASGRVTLATAHPGTGVALALADSGVVVPPGQPQFFVDALSELASDATRRRRLGDAARRQALETLSLDAILTGFERELSTLIGLPDTAAEVTNVISQDSV